MMPRDTVCFDDVLLVPQLSDIISREEISLETSLGDKTFRLPIVSSPMDTVTESKMAMAMFRHGGLGIIHRYNTIEQQCEIVRDIYSSFEETSNSNMNKILGISSFVCE